MQFHQVVKGWFGFFLYEKGSKGKKVVLQDM